MCSTFKTDSHELTEVCFRVISWAREILSDKYKLITVLLEPENPPTLPPEIYKIAFHNGAWQHMPIIPAHRRLRQEITILKPALCHIL
jgi:hypothetical protein